MRVNIHLFNTPFKNESRALKEAQDIINQKIADKIVFYVSWEEGLKKEEYIQDNILVVRKKPFFYHYTKRDISHKFIVFLRLVIYPFRVLVDCYKYKAVYINCHNADLLPGAYFLKVLSNAKLIYDPHELERHRMGVVRSKINQVISTVSEKTFIKRSNAVIVVGDLIAEWYRKEYNIDNVYVIRNTPILNEDLLSEAKSNIFRKKFNIEEDAIIYIYQGILSDGRSTILFLKMFSEIKNSTRHHIVFMGFGELEKLVKEYANKFPNIHFQEAVPPDQIIKYTKAADIGLCIIENKCLSYYYSLPNKFFEYIHAGLPVITSNFPEMERIVNKYNCGWTIPPEDEEGFIKLVEEINKESIRKKYNKLSECREGYNWQKESKKYLEIYKFLK